MGATRRHRSKQQRRLILDKFYRAFRAYDFRIDGEVEAVDKVLTERGINLDSLLDLEDRERLYRETRSTRLRAFLADIVDDIDGQRMRAVVYDGTGWIHLPGRLWLMTERPNEPDAPDRRAIITEEVKACGKLARVSERAFTAIRKGFMGLLTHIVAGKVYEQPSVWSQDDSAAS